MLRRKTSSNHTVINCTKHTMVIQQPCKRITIQFNVIKHEFFELAVLRFALKYSISRELADKPQDKDRMTNIISTYLIGPSLCVANSHRGSGNARIRAYTNQNLIRKLSRRSHFK